MIERRWLPAKITDRSGETLADVTARVWRTTSQQTAGGQRYDWRGVCSKEAREHLIGTQNMLLSFVEGPTYRVQDAYWFDALEYVEVVLVEVKNQG